MLNEQSRKSKRKAERRKKLGPRPNFPEGQASDDVTPAHNPHGSGGEERGIKKKDRKVPKVMPKYASRKAKMEMSHTVYQDMGYLMAESLGLISEKTRMAKEVEKKGPEHRFKTSGGESIRGGSLVRKASTEPGGSQHPRNNARDKYGRTGKERGEAAARLRQPGERTAKVSNKKLARGLSTKGTNPFARRGTPGGDLQARMRKKNFNPMATKMKRTKTKAEKIAAEREEGKAGKRDK